MGQPGWGETNLKLDLQDIVESGRRMGILARLRSSTGRNARPTTDTLLSAFVAKDKQSSVLEWGRH